MALNFLISRRRKNRMLDVHLIFDKLITSLAGNRFGRETYRKQISSSMTEEGVDAILPDNIEDIASSFYEGLFAELNEKYGTERAHELLIVSTNNEYINRKMSLIRKTYGV